MGLATIKLSKPQTMILPLHMIDTSYEFLAKLSTLGIEYILIPTKVPLDQEEKLLPAAMLYQLDKGKAFRDT